MRISKSPLNLFEVFEEKLSSIIDKITYRLAELDPNENVTVPERLKGSSER